MLQSKTGTSDEAGHRRFGGQTGLEWLQCAENRQQIAGIHKLNHKIKKRRY